MTSNRSLAHVGVLVLVLLYSRTALAQPAPSSSGDAPSILEYIRFMREEDKAHREYLESLYSKTAVALGLLGTATIGVLGFLQFKTRKDVKDAVDAQFRGAVEKQLQDRMEQFNVQLADAHQKAQDAISDLQSIVAGILNKGAPESASAPPSNLDQEEEEVLKLIGQSEYSFRSLNGILTEARQEKGLAPDAVTRCVQSLASKGLIGKTLGKKGGDRWYVTEAGRKRLIS